MEHTEANRKTCNPAVTKSVRIFLAGGLWICVGVMLQSLAVSWLLASARSDRLFFAGSGVALALCVHHFGFLRIVDKNLERICSGEEKKCIFSFMPWKSYLIVPVMITAGFVLRHSPIPKEYLAILYLGIGLALTLSSVRYVRVLLKEKKSRMTRMLFMCGACALLLAGCDYTVPEGEELTSLGTVRR